MDNHEFLSVVGDSFKKFLETGSRSNEKLKILHGAIAKDLQKRLGNEYWVQSLPGELLRYRRSQGFCQGSQRTDGFQEA